MLLPQSSAFMSLRNRLNAVSSLGFVHISPRRFVFLFQRKAPRFLVCGFFAMLTIGEHPFPFRVNSAVASGTLGTRSKIVRDEIKWVELLSHFRNVQIKHEKSRRTGLSGDTGSVSGFSVNGETGGQSNSSREKLNGERSSERSSSATGVRDGIPTRPQPRRKASATGGGVLSPLNPKRATGMLTALSGGGSKPPISSGSRPLSPPLAEKQRRALGLRK